MICPDHLGELGHLSRNLCRHQPNKLTGYETAISAQLQGNPSGQSVLSNILLNLQRFYIRF